jgi:hypothetical protein
LVSDIDMLINNCSFDILAKDKLGKIADDVKASGKKSIFI